MFVFVLFFFYFRGVLAAGRQLQRGSVVTGAWASRPAAIWTTAGQMAAGHRQANGGSAGRGLRCRQRDEWWLRGKCQNYKLHPTLTRSSPKVYLHFHTACALKYQCEGFIGRLVGCSKTHCWDGEFSSNMPVWGNLKKGGWKDLSLPCPFVLFAQNLSFQLIQMTEVWSDHVGAHQWVKLAWLFSQKNKIPTHFYIRENKQISSAPPGWLSERSRGEVCLKWMPTVDCVWTVVGWSCQAAPENTTHRRAAHRSPSVLQLDANRQPREWQEEPPWD